MASASFSSTFGDADAGPEQRSSLIAALRARFGSSSKTAEVGAEALVPAKEEEAPDDPFAYLSDYLFSHAQDAQTLGSTTPANEASTGDRIADSFMQMDKGLDVRSKVLDALKVQMSIIPTQAPATSRPAGAAGGGQVIDLDLDEPAESPSHSGLAVPPAFHAPPEVCPCGNVPKRTAKFCIQCGKPWEALDVTGMPVPPPAKRLRVDPAGLAPPLVPEPTPVPVSATPAFPPKPPEPAVLPQVQLAPPGRPAAPAEPSGPEQASAEAAELAARKAAMLQRLQAAETMQQPGAGAQAAPSSTAGKAGPPTSTGSSSTSPSVAPDERPAGQSQEEYEKYRRKCWEQYYEYTSVWQKYYSQHQAELSGKGGMSEKGKTKGKPRPPSGAVPADLLLNPALVPPSGMSGGNGLGAPPHVVAPPGLAAGKGGGGRPGAPPTAMSGYGAVASANQLAAAKAKPAEVDIHSLLLGL
jgi:hypothetical protein